MRTFTDQTGRKIDLPVWPPKRIISLVPSQTELLHYLGLEEEVIGITKFCVHPREWYRGKTRIGGTKTIKTQEIRSLEPDLIIGNKEENPKELILELSEAFPLWLSEVYTLEHALDMIREVGVLVHREQAALTLVGQLSRDFGQLPRFTRKPTVAYLIWDRPKMVAAKHTFIHNMLSYLGLENAFPARERYPEVTDLDLISADPDLIFLSSEPYPYKEKHMKKYQRLCPRAVVKLVDGELFSWYGSRLLHSPSYFKTLQEELQQVL